MGPRLDRALRWRVPSGSFAFLICKLGTSVLVLGSPPVVPSPQMLADDAEAGAEDEKEVEELKKQGINPLPKPPPGVGLLPTPPRPPGPQAPTSPNGRPMQGPPGPPPPPPPPPPGPPQIPVHEPLSPQQQDMYNKKIPSLFEIVVRPTGQLAEKLGVR